MTSPSAPGPVSSPRAQDDLAGFRSSSARVLVRSRRWLVALAVLLLLVPVGAWFADREGIGGQGEPSVRGVERQELWAQAVLLVLSASCGEDPRCGTGFVLEIDDEAVVVTNRHVVEGRCSTTVQPLDGSAEVAVTEVRLATDLDVGVLVLDEVVDRSPLVIGADVLLGQAIRVVGFPGAQPAVLPGYVQRIEPAGLVLAIEADHGASGSPVVDAAGEVVGQLYARRDEECCVALPIADVVEAARGAAPVAACS
ncbi:MAG: serine protease [Nitriliruptor sp.]|nr:MAG: serine protease [Nitriliruptor sp.]